jgi:hypothetical protein
MSAGWVGKALWRVLDGRGLGRMKGVIPIVVCLAAHEPHTYPSSAELNIPEIAM